MAAGLPPDRAVHATKEWGWSAFFGFEPATIHFQIIQMNLHTAFARTADRCGDKPAVYWGEQEFSFAQVRQQARAVAARLREEFGIKPGDRVAIWLKNCPQFPAVLFGAWEAGAVVVMVNTFFKPDEVGHILDDSGARVMLSEGAFQEAQARLGATRPGLRFFLLEQLASAAAPAAPSAAADPSEADLAALLYTSGTTGRPKGAMLTHGNFLHNVASCVQCLEVTDDDRIAVLLPQFHSFMFTVGTLLPMLSGAGIVLVRSVHPLKSVLEEIIRRRATVLPAVPQIYRALAEAPVAPDWPLRLCVSGGAPLPLEVFHAFKAKFPTALIEGYGPTESSPVASVNPIRGVNKPGSVGKPIPNVEMSIRDEAGTELPAGATGEICIRGGNVMRGYWNQPEETAKVLRDGWLYTGDVGHQDADGYFFITDRKKDMLLVNGINVYPREVEEVIYKFPGVREAAVIGIKDARKGEAPMAFVALTEGATLVERELLGFIRERLADYKVPRHVRLLPALPRNATGKILKTELRKLARE
jgi:long-chain acyl-CoA synthetase